MGKSPLLYPMPRALVPGGHYTPAASGREDKNPWLPWTLRVPEKSIDLTGQIPGGLFHIPQIDLAAEIDARVFVFKRHWPYFESDHILNLSYNLLAGGRCIEDLEYMRNDPGYLDMLGAQRIPDPTTVGDFCRRFEQIEIEALQEAINASRIEVWKRQRKVPKTRATIDLDGTIAPIWGECKASADFSYKEDYGYAPLIVSLAETGKILYVCNRPGNRPSHDGCVPYIDRSVDLVRRSGFRSIRLRGDTDFSLTANFDRWTENKVEFVLGMDAHRSLLARAEALAESCWIPLKRPQRRSFPKTGPRTRPENVKDKVVKACGFKRLRLTCEHMTEVEYTPTRTKGTYRLVILRKNISVEQSEDRLFDEIRYFFSVVSGVLNPREIPLTPLGLDRGPENFLAQDRGLQRTFSSIQLLSWKSASACSGIYTKGNPEGMRKRNFNRLPGGTLPRGTTASSFGSGGSTPSRQGSIMEV